MAIQAHFDESGTDAAEITVAGYIFEESRVQDFEEKWDQVLARFDVPFFHMVDCAHGNSPFDDLDKTERIKLQMVLMGLIKRYSVNGFVCHMDNAKQDGYVPATQKCLDLVRSWCTTTKYEGDISYFFESGARGQGELDIFMSNLGSSDDLIHRYRYQKHAFLSKLNNPGVQAADFLAWQYQKYTKDRNTRSVGRLDLRALMRHPHVIYDSQGVPPKESAFRSVNKSRSFNESIHYLPRREARPSDTVIAVMNDIVPLSGNIEGRHLACANCFRVLVENSTPSEIFQRFAVPNNLLLRCWCGRDSLVPAILAPYAH